MKRRPPKTLAEQGYLNLRNSGLGPLKAVNRAADACATIAALAWFSRDLDHWPTQAEYAEHYQVSVSTAEREWRRVREAFPGETSPDRLAQHVAAQLGNRVENLAAAQSVPFQEPALA